MQAKLLLQIEKGKTKFFFFSGKGGEGKSTMSCATAAWLATKGYRTLIVTTDPAPNLSDIFGQKIGPAIKKIRPFKSLFAIEIDPDLAAKEYKEKLLAPLKNPLNQLQFKTAKAQLDSPCVEEIAAFDKFVDFMDGPKYDVVIFDTAPTGHTLRLLELPSGWSSEIDRGGSTCIGPTETLQAENKKYKNAIALLQDSQRASFVFVLKPEEISLKETQRSLAELEKLGINVGTLIVNGALEEKACTDNFFSGIRKGQQEIIGRIENEFPGTEKIIFPLLETELNGPKMLGVVGKALFEGQKPKLNIKPGKANKANLKAGKQNALPLLEPKNGTRFLFFTGKGGVGKSTIACSASVYLANKGFKTLIVTTDPASHLQNIFGQSVEYEPTQINGQSNLFAARVDPIKTFEEYKKRIMYNFTEKLTQSGLKINVEATKKKIEEDLRSPCAQEMASFEKFMSFFEIRNYDVVVIDTAPTGHTLRLLELPTIWKGFIDIGTLAKHTNNEKTQKYAKIIDIMRDKDKSTFVFVMFPEYTPIIEAFRASKELKAQVGINAGLVAVNYILPEHAGKNSFFNNRRKQQSKYMREIKKRFKTPLVLVPLLEKEPKGVDALKQLGEKIFE